MTSLLSPTVGQVATLTNGFSYQWDGAVWTLAAVTGGQVAGGDLTGTYPNPQIAAGTIVDADMNASAGVQFSKMEGAGAAAGRLSGTYPNPGFATYPENAINGRFDMNSTGGLYFRPSPTTIAGEVSLDSDNMNFLVNHIWGPQDATRSSWYMLFGTNPGNAWVDGLHFMHRKPNAATGAWSEVMYLRGSDEKVICSLADNSVSRAMTQGGTPVGMGTGAYNTSFSTTAYNTWVNVASFSFSLTCSRWSRCSSDGESRTLV